MEEHVLLGKITVTHHMSSIEGLITRDINLDWLSVDTEQRAVMFSLIHHLCLLSTINWPLMNH